MTKEEKYDKLMDGLSKCHISIQGSPGDGYQFTMDDGTYIIYREGYISDPEELIERLIIRFPEE